MSDTNISNEGLNLRKESSSSHQNKNFQDYENSMKTFIPNIFKEDQSKPSRNCATDPFITSHSAKEYCSLLNLDNGCLPGYLEHFKEFTDNVLDIPEQIFDDIAKVHIERENKFKEEEEEDERRLAHQHALDLKEKSTMDIKVARLMKSSKFYVKRSCPVKIPFKSTLTHDEHEFYIKCFIKFQIRRPVNALEQKEYEQYISMQNRVFDEQSCMMNFSYKVSQLVLNEYNNVPLTIHNYIKEYVSHRCQRAFSYPSKYISEIEIPLKLQTPDSASDNFQFMHIGHLLSLGNIPWLYFPKPYFKTSLPKDDSIAMRRRPDCDDDFDRSHYLYKCPVSEDPNAEYLAKLHHASVVMTPGAFKVIMNNQEQPFDKEWNIPVKIKTCKVKDDNGKEYEKRIIYIDKPLPKKTWLPLQKKSTFYKVSSKAVLTGSLTRDIKYFRLNNPNQVQNYSSKRSYAPSAEDNIFGSLSNEESVESFGLESTSFSSSKSQPKSRQYKKKEVLPEELAKDLFLSEDEEDSRNSFEQGHNIPTPENTLKLKTYSTDLKRANSSTSSQSSHTSTSNSISQEEAASPSPLDCVKSEGDKFSPSLSSSTRQRGAAFAPPISYAPVKRPHKDDFQSFSASTSEQFDSSFRLPKKEKLGVENPTGLLDDILDKQSSFLKLKTSPPYSKNSETVGNSFGSSKIPKPWSGTIKTDWNDKNFQIKECPTRDVNVHYQLFSFTNLKQCPVKEECPKPVKVLVRHNVHGMAKNQKEPPKFAKAYVLFPKIENQVFFGAEVNSLSEIIQQWSDLLLRPNTHLLQIRVCTESGDVLMTDEKTLDGVLKEGKQNHLNFNPQQAFSTFNVLVTTLMRMSSGDYLLHHSPKTEAFMKLLKSSNNKSFEFSSSTIDLHQYYSDCSISSKQYRSSPWLAIDTHVLTPFHVAHQKIPATFPMENMKKLSKNERQKRKTRASNKLSLEGFQ